MAIKSEKDKIRTNREIRVSEVRLIDEKGEQVGIVSIQDALDRAAAVGVDLVEVSPNSQPPVCRILDYGKYVFQLNKQKAAAKKNQKRMQVKEVKLRPGTEEGDYQVKLRNLTRFLEAGDKAKITMRFRGREMVHKELGLEVLKRIEEDLADMSTVEQKPKLEGRQMVMVLAPSKSKVVAKPKTKTEDENAE